MINTEIANKRLLCLIGFYTAYLFIGAFIFDTVEEPHEAQLTKEINQFIQVFSDRHNSCITHEDLTDFIKVISLANDRGIPATKNVSREQNWSFGQSIFYACTVLTTIGYGNISPLTNFGKIFLLLFSIIGLPTTLLLLYAIIDRLMKLKVRFMSYFTERALRITNNIPALKHVVKHSHVHVFFAIFSAVVVLIFLLVIPAGIYAHIEGWAYLDAFYYCFISLTTVGLGDYIPGDADNQAFRQLYKLCSIVYLLLGVTVMVWLLETFSETPEFNFYKYFTLTENGILTNHYRNIKANDYNIEGNDLTCGRESNSSSDYSAIVDDRQGSVDMHQENADSLVD